MFTGIIQTTGKVASKKPEGDGVKFYIQPEDASMLANLNIGDSIAINGACMTVEDTSDNVFTFTTISESLTKTNLGLLEPGSCVNLEPAMTMNSKLDGHIVQGHVDTTGLIKDIKPLENSREYFIEFPARFRSNVIYVGSIAINGVSLTVAEIVSEDETNVVIKTAIIPHTYEVTNFKELNAGDKVNIEFDMIGKYVQRAVEK